jgi:putative transposase
MPTIPSTKPEIESATDVNWSTAVERERLIASLSKTDRVRRADVDAVARCLSLSRAMVYRLLARYRQAPRTSSLLADAPGRKHGSFALDDRVEAVVARSIKTFFLSRERPSVTALHRVICAECRKLELKAPSYTAVRARTRATDLKELVQHRVGSKAARDRFRPVSGKGLRPTRPLELFQIDHTLVDVIVVDEIDRRPIGRPWLTLVIDVATRMIAGYYLSFDHPSSTSVALALSRAVLPKETYLRNLGVIAEWPVSGLPEVVHLDNAKEFHARALERGCQEHGIRLEYRPPLRPHFGGHIERLIGSMMKAMRLLPGTTFTSAKERGEYDSEGNAVMTIRELEQWFAMQVTGAYHVGFHRGLGARPVDAWMHALDSTHASHPADPERFYIDFLPFERRLIRRDGIQMFRIHYWDNALSVLTGRSEQKFLIRYDPRDLSKVFVKGAGDDNGYLAVSYRDLKHPPVTLMEQRIALRELAKEKQRPITEDTIFSTIAGQRALVQRARHKTLTARRKAQQGPRSSLRSIPAIRTQPVADDTALSDEPVEPYAVELWE